MPKPIWHDGGYWHRKRVPTDIRATYPKKEEWESLRTAALAVARRRLPDAMKAVQARFDAHRQTFRAGSAELPAKAHALPLSINNEWFADLSEMCQYFRGEVLEEGAALLREQQTQQALDEPDAFWAGTVVPLRPDTSYDSIVYALADAYRHGDERLLERLRVSLAIRDLSLPRLLYQRCFKGELDKVHLIALTRTNIKFLEDQLADTAALYPTLEELVDLAPKESVTQAQQVSTDKDPLLTEAVKTWLAQCEDFSQDRIDEIYTSVDLLVEIAGDKPVSAYDKDDVRELKSILTALPRHRRKLQQTRLLTAREAAERAKELGLPTLHASTRNDYLGRLSNFFEWAESSYSAVSGNPFNGKGVAFPDSEPRRGKRNPFTTEELTRLFASSAFTCLERDTAKFWAPLLLLFTGCRANEILKLKVSDIRSEDGIPFVDINEDPHRDTRVWHRVKMKGANVRRIPIHRELVAMGLMAFVAMREKEGCERLFRELNYNHKGKFSDAFGKWFNRLLKHVAVKRPKIDTHSLRHNFADACDSSRISQDITLMLKDGPGSKRGTLAYYGHGRTDIEILAEEMAKLRFKGLDLSHLHTRRSAAESSRDASVSA